MEGSSLAISCCPAQNNFAVSIFTVGRWLSLELLALALVVCSRVLQPRSKIPNKDLLGSVDWKHCSLLIIYP